MNNNSEIAKINGSKYLLVSFGGMAQNIGGIVPFEFLNYLSKVYENQIDLLFYIDKNQFCYHKGIQQISNTVEETVDYLNNKIQTGNYEKVIFMGTSGGGYASILFGSLCKVTHVIGFIAPTILRNPKFKIYTDLKEYICPTTQYLLYGDVNIQNKLDAHHISHCERLECFPNVKVIRSECIDLKKMRDIGEFKKIIDGVLYDSSI
jgi:predicted esterase YcpF (UPF0227 family)